MSDLPGPEKPLLPDEPVKLHPNELMRRFREQLAAGTVTRGRPNGAGGSGPYDGRSGRFLKGRIRPRHEMVVMLEAVGYKNNEIAAAMGYTPSRVSVILKSQHPQLKKIRAEAAQRVANNTADLGTRFQLLAPDAFDRMVDIMRQNDDVANARLAAKDILDRAGYSPVKKIASMTANVPLDELAQVMGQIEKANDVAARRDDWAVQDVEQNGAA